MAEIRSPEAKQLCTATEFQLFKTSLGTLLQRLTPAQLRTKVSRTRKLRDKYRDLAHRQRREARGKQQPRGARASRSNDRTVRKVDLFNQIMSRFEDRLKSLESTAKKEKKSSTASKKKTAERSRKKTAKTKVSAKKKRASKPAVAEDADSNADESETPSRAKKRGKSFMEMLGATPPPRELGARASRRKEKSRTSTAASRKDIRESAASKKIKGHVSASNKRAQGRRDSK